MRFLLFSLGLVFQGAFPCFASKDAIPDWVRSAAAQAPPKTSPETNAIVLLDDTVVSVSADGKAVEHHRYAVRILRPQGRSEGVLVLPYDKDRKILSLHLWSIGPDGHEYSLKDNEIADLGYPTAGVTFEDLRFKQASAPGRDPGALVAYEYEQRIAPYMHEYTWEFQGELPHVQQALTLELPAGYRYQTTWAHHDPEKAIDLEHERFRWELNQVPAINLDRVPLHPSLYALTGRMTVHYGVAGPALGSWQEIGEWYEGLSRDRLMPSPEIAAKANELTTGKSDFYQRAEAISEFVQRKIRYFAIEVRVGGYQPHQASDVFRTGYGDCKDKATLLSAMLQSAGIHSALMMVDDRRGVVDPASPSIVGDHMIAAIEIPKGYQSQKLRATFTSKTGKRYLIFDPTWDLTPFGQIAHNLQGSFGVLMEGKDTEAIALPVLDPELNSVRRTAVLQLQPDGTLKGAVTERRFGDLSEEIRRLYTEGDEKTRTDAMNQEMSNDLVAFRVSSLQVENVVSLNEDLTTKFELSADRFSKVMGPLMLIRPRVYGSEGVALEHKLRTVPIDLRQTKTIKDDFTIELPAGYEVDELPAPLNMDVGFASYESSSKLEGQSLHYRRTFTVRQVVLPPERFGDLEKLEQAIETDEQSNAVFKRKQ